MKKINIPGSKSISNRALVLAALSDSPTVLHGLLECDDTVYLRNALTNFGVTFKSGNNNSIIVIPPTELNGNDSKNFIGNAGTPARFLSALSLVTEGEFTLHGIPRMHERPFGDLFEALQTLGTKISSSTSSELRTEKSGFLPARFLKAERPQPNLGGIPEKPKEVTVSGKISSQFVSGLLLAATKMPVGLTVNINGIIPSRPYVEMTIRMIELFGGTVQGSIDEKKLTVLPGLKNPAEFTVAVDCSSASYAIAYSLLKKEPIEIQNFAEETMQGDEGFLKVAEQFGAKIIRGKSSVQVAPPKKLHALGIIDFSTMPDVSMTAMAIAMFADGVSHFTGLESLRVKECDRIEAMKQGIESLGGTIEVRGNDVIVSGNSRLKISSSTFQNSDSKSSELRVEISEIDSHDDHRIAMVFGLIRSVFALNFQITDEHCVAKSWPEFWVDLAKWEKKLRPVAALIIKKEKSYLLVEKPRKNNAWQFPQGGVDAGETFREAAARELAEECGDDITVQISAEKIGEYSYLFPKNFKRRDHDHKGANVHFFSAEYVRGEVQVDEKELIGHAWLIADEIQAKVSPEYWQVVKQWIV